MKRREKEEQPREKEREERERKINAAGGKLNQKKTKRERNG